MSKGGRVQITIFTIEEANRAATEMRPELEELVHVQRELSLVQSRIDVLDLAASGANELNPDARELRSLQTRRTVLSARVRRGLHSIHRRGAVVKDLDQGLIDFYALSGDRLVFLCWRLDETEVAHWHPIEGGFRDRQPVHRREID